MSEMTLNEMIDLAYEVRERKYALSAELEKLSEQFSILEEKILVATQEMNIKSAGTETAKISVSEEVVPNVVDWDAAFAYIKNSDAFYLLRKQLNSGPYREALSAGTDIPGVVPFHKRKLSLRKV